MRDLSLLSNRQREVAELVAQGMTDKDIQCQLSMEFGTLRAHLTAIADRLGLDETRNLRVQIASLVFEERYRESA